MDKSRERRKTKDEFDMEIQDLKEKLRRKEEEKEQEFGTGKKHKRNSASVGNENKSKRYDEITESEEDDDDYEEEVEDEYEEEDDDEYEDQDQDRFEPVMGAAGCTCWLDRKHMQLYRARSGRLVCATRLHKRDDNCIRMDSGPVCSARLNGKYAPEANNEDDQLVHNHLPLSHPDINLIRFREEARRAVVDEATSLNNITTATTSSTTGLRRDKSLVSRVFGKLWTNSSNCKSIRRGTNWSEQMVLQSMRSALDRCYLTGVVAEPPGGGGQRPQVQEKNIKGIRRVLETKIKGKYMMK